MKTLVALVVVLSARLVAAQPDPDPGTEPAPPPPPAPNSAPTPPPPPPRPVPVARDPRAAQMTSNAELAALQGDCVVAKVLGPRVKRLDPAYFQAAFVTNVAITNCRQGVALGKPSADGPLDADAWVAKNPPHYGATIEIGIGGGGSSPVASLARDPLPSLGARSSDSASSSTIRSRCR